MATIATIRDGLKDRLATISGLQAYTVWPDYFVAPGAIVQAVEEEYHQAMGGSGGHSIVRCEVLIAVSLAAGWEWAAETLDPYLSRTGVSSIRAAIEGDKTLGGVVDTLTVTGWREYGMEEINGESFLAAIVLVEVFNNA